MYAPDTEIRIKYTFRSKRYFFLDSVLVLNALAHKSSDLLEFNQTQNAAMFSSKCETFVYRYITPIFVGHSFRVKMKLGTFLPTQRWAF